MNFLRSRKGDEGKNTKDTPEEEKEKKKKKNFIKVAFNYIKYFLDNKVKSKYKYSFFMGLFIIFLIFNGFFQKLLEFYHTYFYKFEYIDVSDTNKLKEIFFSNKPYLVYCKNDKQEIIHPTINLSRSSFPDILKIAIINCKSLLPSQQTVYERFSMDPETKAFIVCYGRKPKPITQGLMNNRKKFVSFVREALVFSVPFFSKFPQFQTKCLNKNKKCILFISGIHMTNASIKYNYINDIFVNNKYFDLSPMIIDNRKFLLKLSDEVFSSYDKKRDIHVLCLFNSTEGQEDNYYGYFYKDDFEDFNKLSSFVAECVKFTSKSTELVKLSAVPQIKYRSSKNK
ncbi:hypothetical protein AK88_01904 [Plasmodium fragile]|uniref:Uncharacterized protein n=1 Tax=Plasmodium fragile TaxID=5857 RepID=A0A0D9QNS1_PLAFR|nr:uncharacterized protein AK88_01904 [Plasmodium fragile]KJP88452.1 hypothetical protein AK88_01904 [Plasmodium fragile]